MKVRWSTTHTMAFKLRNEVDYFVGWLGLQEKDSAKQKKIMDLELSSEEWIHVQRLVSILGYAKLLQQSFLSEQGQMLHLALPVLESLHSAWSLHSGCIKYLDFVEGLDAGIEKIAKYYEKLSSSDAHIMAMLLDPSQKETHIRKY
ncbi:hypothetical protein F4604DRAFT_2023314 [Suillus subluteus]|nr:hypothetical protein F4604DRAFT_2023314 [Suillus subluteus]